MTNLFFGTVRARQQVTKYAPSSGPGSGLLTRRCGWLRHDAGSYSANVFRQRIQDGGLAHDGGHPLLVVFFPLGGQPIKTAGDNQRQNGKAHLERRVDDLRHGNNCWGLGQCRCQVDALEEAEPQADPTQRKEYSQNWLHCRFSIGPENIEKIDSLRRYSTLGNRVRPVTSAGHAEVGRGARLAVVAPPSHPLWGESRDGRDRRQRVPMRTRAALPAGVDCVANRDGAGSRIPGDQAILWRLGQHLRRPGVPGVVGAMHRGTGREGSSTRSALALGVDGGRRPGVCRAPDAPLPAGFSQCLSSCLQDGPF